MEQHSLLEPVTSFFSSLRSFGGDGQSKQEYLAQSVYSFLQDESKETALQVYEVFFGTYRITLGGERNPFVDLLDTLRAYEERAASIPFYRTGSAVLQGLGKPVVVGLLPRYGGGPDAATTHRDVRRPVDENGDEKG